MQEYTITFKNGFKQIVYGTYEDAVSYADSLSSKYGNYIIEGNDNV